LIARLGPEAIDAIEEFLSLSLSYERDQTPSLEGFLDWIMRGVRSWRISCRMDVD